MITWSWWTVTILVWWFNVLIFLNHLFKIFVLLWNKRKRFNRRFWTVGHYSFWINFEWVLLLFCSVWDWLSWKNRKFLRRLWYNFHFLQRLISLLHWCRIIWSLVSLALNSWLKHFWSIHFIKIIFLLFNYRWVSFKLKQIDSLTMNSLITCLADHVDFSFLSLCSFNIKQCFMRDRTFRILLMNDRRLFWW